MTISLGQRQVMIQLDNLCNLMRECSAGRPCLTRTWSSRKNVGQALNYVQYNKDVGWKNLMWLVLCLREPLAWAYLQRRRRCTIHSLLLLHAFVLCILSFIQEVFGIWKLVVDEERVEYMKQLKMEYADSTLDCDIVITCIILLSSHWMKLQELRHSKNVWPPIFFKGLNVKEIFHCSFLIRLRFVSWHFFFTFHN